MSYNPINNDYQRGYADGYKRHNQLTRSRSESEYQYVWNVVFVITIFVLFLIGILYTYNSDAGKYSHYEGDCLIDLATTYSSKCLDN
jgi:hypothetical protein